MDGAERWSVVVVGAIGLALWAGGSLLAALRPVDAPLAERVDRLATGRTALLVGSIGAVSGAALLLWPICAVATEEGEAWVSLRWFSVAVWTLGFTFFVVATVVVSTLAWSPSRAPDQELVRVLLDGAHLAVWAVSAPIGAIAVVATTAVGVQAQLFGPLVVLAATAKVATVVVEVAGTGRRTGWNAGGWAAGSSGYVSVAWFALVLAALAVR